MGSKVKHMVFPKDKKQKKKYTSGESNPGPTPISLVSTIVEMM